MKNRSFRRVFSLSPPNLKFFMTFFSLYGAENGVFQVWKDVSCKEEAVYDKRIFLKMSVCTKPRVARYRMKASQRAWLPHAGLNRW